MSAEICGLKLFDDKQVKFVVIKLNASLKKGDLNGFLSYIKQFRHPGNRIRLSPSKADDDIEIADSLRLFDRTIDSVLAAYTGDMSVSEIKKKISDVMNFEMDNTQEDIPSQDNETKTKFEAQDKNRANLTEHYKEFYGLDSYTIIQALQRTFSDRLSTATYYDQFTGEMTDFDNHTLNLRIMDEKARMFKSLVEYLKQQYGEEAADFKSEMYDEDGKLDLINYYNALNFFYDKVKKIDDFSEQLQTQQNNVLLEQEKKEKTDKYTALWNKLYLSDEFKKRADKKFTGFKARQASTKLYEGENYSQYYAFLKKYIEKYGSDDDKKAISEIEKESPSLLSASQAYTMLTHFDQLIKETFGDNIDIQEGLENAEFDSDTKYSYHRDVKHEVKGWQTSEDVGAEKHTSQFTKTVLDMIGVFNYKTGEYTHRRVNSTSLIVASRNLMDALITHNITFKDIKIDFEYTPTPGERRKNKNDYANELYSLARNFHANPVGNLQRILELLFSKQPGMSKALVDVIDIQNQQITGYDLNILKSVYNVVFDRENTNSFFAKASNKAGRENAAANVLLEEIAGYVDRNAVADYLESKFDYSTGLMKLSAKKKFFNVKDQFNTKTRVNQFANSMTTDKLQSLADKYQLTEGQLGDSSAKIGKNTEYSIKIGDYTISLIVSNNIKAGIFGTVRPGQEGTMYFKVTKNEITPEGEEVTKDVVTSEFFQKISNPNIGIATNFRYSKMHSLPLESEGARLLNGVLQFIDDTTGLGLLSNPSKNLQVLGTLQQLYSPIEGFHYFIQPLLRMAMKSAYAEKLRLDANKAGKPLAKYLSDTSNAAYMAYLRSKKSNRSFTEVFNDLRPVVATTFDQTINQWVDAESVLSGQASKATTKDSAGNSIPNNTVAKLGTNLVYYLQKEAAEDSKVRFLLFAQNPDMIVRTFHDLEVTNTEGETKAISDFTNGELFFHAIFNKFWDSYLATGHVIVQPTTYSDKTTFLNWELNPVYKGKNLMTMSKSELLNEYFETLGITTKRILDASTGKLNQIVQAYATGVKAKALKILNSTEKQEDKQAALDNFLNQGENRFFYTSTPQTDLNTMLHHITESQLVAQAQKMDLSVALDHDYVRIKSGFCQLDSSLLFNQKLYNSTTEGGMLDRLLEKQKAIFVQQLLQNYCSYQVLTDGDTVSQYEADTIDSNVKSKNPIIKTILGYCDKQENKIKARTEFFKNWVDESTGKLIIAKQNGRNIMSLSDGFNPNKKVELNPLLDKFFYVEGFLSNQLRYTLTGFETNHPIVTQTQFDKLYEAYNGVVTHKLTSYDQVKQWLDSQSQLDENQRDKNYSDIKFITDSSIFNQAHQAFRFNDLNDLGNYLYSEQGKTDSAHSFLQDLWETSNIQILNNRQSTQFKRNVIISATLQYCVQNSRDGIPPRIKCAVVNDDQAPVYNYRGDHERDIYACDGSAQITPFQCILENRALGSQAVGFIKKPIWHSYDRESGTAFLAKFATDTMTNEAMRSSSASSVRLYNMFRKATNLQWNPADNIDLTRPITMEASISGAEGEALQNWFAKNITCNQPLCYKDKYGNIMEIKLLDRTVTQDGAKYYYTVEKDSYGNTVNKYHIFYDSVDGNGNITKSKHYTFDTYQKAAKFVSEHQGAHTINSLFELHSALGGINSCNKEGIFGEYNNEVVCNYMCNIGSKKPGIKGTPYIDQTTYTQPLKQYQIGYILNNSAVKNGAKNVNQKERWKDDEDLTWFEVDSDGLGMQMNADHDIVDSELTEFSQVIASTSAYGFTYNNCNEIFKGLASTAFQASQQPLVAVNKFLDALAAETDYTVTDAQGNTRPMTDIEAMEADAKNKIKISQAKSDLYDAIGRIIFMNSSIKDNENLTNIIQQAVLHVFNKYSNHEKDEVKLPFSDANIYSDFIATLASTINKNSIKRKHPGTGAVMAPAYNMQQYFEISTDNGPRKLMASDVIRLAQEDYRRQLQDFLIQYGTHPVDESGNANTNIVKEATDEEGFGIGTARIAQLEKKAEQVANLRNKENKSKKSEDGSIPAEIQLPEYYNATHDVDDAHEANVKMLNIYLKQLQAKEPARSLEYFMPSDIVAVFNADGTAVKDKNGNDLIININDLKTYYNFKKGIAPDGTIIMHDMVLKKCTTAPNNLRPSIIRWQYTGADGTDHWMNIFDTPAIKNSWENRGPNYRAEVQATLNDVYNASEGNFNAISELNKNAEWLTGMKADTLENTDAELIMSNLYKDTFGVPDGKSLDQILDEGEDFFRRQTENLQAPKNNIYDYAFLRENGKHTLITIGNVTEDSQTVIEVPFTNITTEGHNAEGFADIYAVERGKKSFKIGRWINDGSVEYRDGKFIKDNQELDQSMYRVKDGIVQRKVNFVTRYNIKTKSTVRGVDFFKNNIMYKVATLDEIKEALQYTSKEAATVTEDTKTTDALRQQKHIIASIFNAGDYKYVEINREKRLQKGKVNAIRNSLIEVLGQGTLDPNLHSAIEDQLDLLSSDDAKKKQHLINVKRDYLEKEAHKKWVSFQDSLKFIAARIPAQTLQSFMTMKLVGWTENSKNMAYVSHFQTYLQGSK